MAEILIVEDDSDLAETYTDLMEARGHLVFHATQLGQAVAHLVEHSPHIITLDLNLPVSSSITMVRFIHQAKTLCTPKIVVISGHPEMISGSDWIDDIDLILSKPVNNHHLITMIDRLLL